MMIGTLRIKNGPDGHMLPDFIETEGVSLDIQPNRVVATATSAPSVYMYHYSINSGGRVLWITGLTPINNEHSVFAIQEWVFTLNEKQSPGL